jgi:DNA polymerase-3 subunit delta
MIYFLFGQDTYQSRQKLREIVEEYKKRHQSGLNFIKINFDEKDLDDFKQNIKTVSMFDEKKLIVVEEVFQQPEYFQEELLNYLKKKKMDIDKNSILVFWAEEVKTGGLFKFLKKKAKTQEFKLLQPHKLREWIKKYIKEQKGNIDNRAVEILIEYVGSDLWRMVNEINKLISFKKQETSNKIQAEDVEGLVKPEIDVNIFNIIDSLGQKNKKQALRLIHDYFKKGESESYLLNRFVYQFRNLIKVKSDGKLDMHPFVIKKTLSQARNFSLDELKKIYYKLLEVDLNIKTGKMNTRTALELFVTEL